jgi:hypothetical protein
MFPQFFVHKYKEVLSVLQILRGKLTGDPQMRIIGVNNALKAMQEERKTYLEEKKSAKRDQLYEDKLEQEVSQHPDKSLRNSDDEHLLH